MKDPYICDVCGRAHWYAIQEIKIVENKMLTKTYCRKCILAPESCAGVASRLSSQRTGADILNTEEEK